MTFYGVIDSVRAPAFAISVFAAVFAEEIRHLSAHAGKALTVSLRRYTQYFSRNTAVCPEHCAQYKNTSAFRVKTLQHNVGAGHFKLLRQNILLHVLRKVGNVVYFSVADIVTVILEAKGNMGEHMLFVIFQMICGDTENPCGKGAFFSEGRHICDNFQQNFLRGVFRVRKCTQHSQRHIEYGRLYVLNDCLKRFSVAFQSLFRQFG